MILTEGHEMNISIRTGTIGPAHDPYGTEEIRITDGDRTAKMYTDGLGANRFELLEGKFPMRSESWFDGDRQAATWRLRADLLAKRFVGISFSAAEELYYGERCSTVPDMAKGWV